ncbi:mitogen-activated protein kinase 7-like [Symphalangus syndactylus]|uniref:mitogen-activated protein kinase 7-like n=1 Tax=Symphalangus syndactylus TaxID=9590 RepID=UPI003004A389
MRSLSPRPPPHPRLPRPSQPGTRARALARPDAGSSRPNGCCSEPEAGDRRKEERRRRRRARPGWDRSGGTLGGLRCACARAALLGASASHTKGLPSQSHQRPQGTVGSAQRGGAVAHPAPQPRSPAPVSPRPHPTPTAPSAAVPTPISATPTLLLGYSPTLSLCSPPYSRAVVEVTFLRSADPGGGEPTGSATPLHAVSGQLSEGLEQIEGWTPYRALGSPRKSWSRPRHFSGRTC